VNGHRCCGRWPCGPWGAMQLAQRAASPPPAPGAGGLDFAFRPATFLPAGLADGLVERYGIAAKDERLSAKEREAAAVLVTAEKRLLQDNIEKALEEAQGAAAIYRELGNQAALADALRVVIHVYRCEERRQGLMAGGTLYSGVRRSSAFVKEQLAHFQRADDRSAIGRMLISAAEVAFDDGEAARSLKLVKDARQILREQKDSYMEASALLVQAELQLPGASSRDAAQEAAVAASQAQELFVQVGNQKGEALALRAMACAQGLAGSSVAAQDFTKEALQLLRRVGNERLQALAQEGAARLHLHLGEAEQAVAPAEEALRLAQGKTGGGAWEASALEAVVSAYLAKGAAIPAQRAVEQSFKRFQAAGDKLGEAYAMLLFSRAHAARGNTTSALSFAEEAASLHKDAGDRRGEVAALSLASELLTAKGQSAKGVLAAQHALKCAKQMLDPADQAVAFRALSRAQLAGGKLPEAAEAASSECTVYQKAGYGHKEARALLNLCEVYTAMGNYEKVVSTGADAQALVHKLGDTKAEATAWLTIAQAQLAAEKYGAAVWAADRAKKLFQDAGDVGQAVAMRLLATKAHLAQAVDNEEKGGPDGDTQKLVEMALAQGAEAVELGRKVGDEQQTAAALFAMAQAQIVASFLGEALQSASEAAELSAKRGDDWEQACALSLCAHVHLLREQPGRAGKAASEAMRLFQRCGDVEAEKWAAGIFDRMETSHEVSMPTFPLTKAKRTAGTSRVGSGLGVARQLMLDEPEVEFDAPLMQAGPSVLVCSALRDEISRQLAQQRTSVPSLFAP